MPRGYPDYFGMSIFPKYGLNSQETGVKACAPGYTTLFTVSGKGRSSGGTIIIYDDDFSVSDQLLIDIDGNNIMIQMISKLYEYNLTDDDCDFIRLKTYKTSTIKTIVMTFVKGITFDQSFSTRYRVMGVGNVQVNYNFLWTQII